MPINNSYNQTPKRIFTNKPFIKGMNYTNADLEPFVCRAVANLELESSNSATKLRKGIVNNILDTDQGLVYKFYKKFVIFTNLITETMYNNNIIPTDVQSADLGIKVINEDKKENDIYGTIITNNTKLEYTTVLNDSLDLFGLTANYKIYALVSDEGRLNHIINNQDYSFMFFGAIFENASIQYKGPIKLYYHVTAQKIIIEVIKPQTLDVTDVKADGVNIVASNPAIYKDWINYRNGPQYYADYFGDTRAVTEEDKNKAIIDITTVALYDAPVEPVPYNNSSNANMLVSISKTKQDPFYIRPFYAIPNTEYGVMVTAQSKDKLDYIYNFTSRSFERKPNNEVTINTSETKSFSLIMQNTFINPNITFNNIDEHSTVTIKADSNKTLFRLAASDENIDTSLINSDLTSGVITDPYITFQYRLVTSYKYTIPIKGNIYYGNVSAINNNNYDSTCSVDRIDYLYRKSILEQGTVLCTPTINNIITSAIGYDFVFRDIDSNRFYDGDRITLRMKVPQNVNSFTINMPNYSKSAIDNCIRTPYSYDITNIKLTIAFGEYVRVIYNYNDIRVNSTYNSDYSNDTYTASVTTGSDYNDYIGTQSEEGQGASMLSLLLEAEENTPAGADTYKVIIYEPDYAYYHTCNIDKRFINLEYNIPQMADVYVYTASLSTDYTKVAQSDQVTSSDLAQTFNINYTNNTLTITQTLRDNSSFVNRTVKTPIAETLNKKTSTQLSDILNDYSVLTATLSSNNNIAATYPIDVLANLHYYQINKMNCHYIENDGYSIPINRRILDNIDTSTFKVTLFPYEEFNESSVYYKPNEFVEKTLYSFGTSNEEIVDYSTYKSNPLFSKSLNMTNHLGHTVVWGDHTDSNSLYYSAFNDISYFPSNYVFTFDNPIVYAYPHRDSLVVFTTDDIYMLHSGNVPSTTATDGLEVPFTQSLIQANTRLGKQNIDTVRAIGKDLFFINNNNQGYLLKSNKYVSDVSDVYLIKLTSQIDDLLDNPYQYAKERYMKWYPNSAETSISSKLNTISKTLGSITTSASVIISGNYRVIDGDTIEYNNQSYRLMYANTPEVKTNDRLADTAKYVLIKLMSQASNIVLYKTNTFDIYGRHLAYLSCDGRDVSAIMLYNGLAEYYDSSYTGSVNTLYNRYYSSAKLNQRGIHNNNKYTELTENDIVTFTELNESIDIYKPVWNTNSNELYCYTTNSYVYIIQAIKLDIEKAITIFYKYSIDAKVWTTYDIPAYIKPNDIIPDNNTVGFKILCNNDRRGKASLLEFKESSQDVLQYKFTKSNDLGEYTLGADLKYNYINVYFDSGNQSISLMNDKLFREIKLLLGALPNSLLSMDYSIDFYTDGKLVIPNQVGNCDTHIHHKPINTHYKGNVENLEGFQKVTFFAPARGRIPRIVFSLTCESDINILEYAIVYMQLNAK